MIFYLHTITALLIVLRSHGFQPPSRGRSGSSLKLNPPWQYKQPQNAKLISRSSLQGVTLDDIQVGIYDLQLHLSSLIETDLHNSISPLVTIILISAGVLSSLSPCSLGLIPITINYLLESSNKPSQSDDSTVVSFYTTVSLKNRPQPKPKQATSETYFKLGFFAIGVILAFTILGGSATLVGSTVNQISVPGIQYIRDLGIPAIYISMGLSLFEILPPINLSAISTWMKGSFPSKKTEESSVARAGQATIAGLTAALVGTSCTTPVLTALITFISNQANLQIAILALFFYSVGYLMPLVFSMLVLNQIKLSEYGGRLVWINDLFAMLLLGYGSYLLGNTIFQTIHWS